MGRDVRVTVVFNQQLERNQVFHGCGPRNARTLEFLCGHKFANKCPDKTGESGYHLTASTKTLAGMREIPVLPELVDVLRKQNCNPTIPVVIVGRVISIAPAEVNL